MDLGTKLDWKFWLPIIIGAVIGLIVSIVANITTPVVLRYWKTRRDAKLEDNKRKAFETHRLLKRFHERIADCHLYFIELQCRITIGIVLGSAAMLLSVLLPGEAARQSTSIQWGNSNVYISLAFAGLSMLSLTQAMRRFRRFKEWRWRLDNFEKYEADLHEKYGVPN